MIRTSLALSLLLSVAVAQGEGDPILVDEIAIGLDGGEPLPAELLAKVQWYAAGPVAAPKWTLWVGSDAVRLRDQRGYLEELQRRHAEQGLRVALLVPAAKGKELADGKLPFAIGSVDVAQEPTGCWLGRDTEQARAVDLDGIADVLPLAFDDKDLGALLEQFQGIASLLQVVGDGGDFVETAAQLANAWPHSGRAQALVPLAHWWCTGDVEAARKAVIEGLRKLGGDTLPLATFCDLALRGDRSDPTLAKEIAMAIAPAAAALPDSPFVQLVQLRALLRAGQDKLAGRLVPTIGKLCTEPQAQITYAETLMDANEPLPYRDIAERALAEVAKAVAAAAQPGESGHVSEQQQLSFYEALPRRPNLVRELLLTRHKVLLRCGAIAEAEALLKPYRGDDGAGGLNAMSLNNDAWYTMVQPATMGRFDAFALAQCLEMQRREGDQMSYGNKDTVSLALFLNSKLQEAIELETVALAASQNDPEYKGRLTRYQNTLAARSGKK